ncbi:MAG: tRNA pseudouridine(55) synthase TruB [Bacteroidaceae bacterium]|nr:tRNA pseudouridine(55) synthase TruB [Bacteroidaceae bacterium]
MDFQAGEILAFDKPYRMTSFQLVARVRYLLCRKLGVKKLKVGHAGTLDPLATGVEIICTGRATKQIEALQLHEKEYVAGLRLGATTPSFDLEHPVDATYPYEHVTPEMLEATLRQFEGDVEQVPPVFSACKIAGDRACDLARKGRDVSLKPKNIHIASIKVERFELPDVVLRVTCGKGTYIRALARDIGQALGCGAHLTALRRIRVGNVNVETCHNLDTFPEWLNFFIEH